MAYDEIEIDLTRKDAADDGMHSRFDALVGKSTRKMLQTKSVAIFGLGGVGGSAAEAVARSFVGRIFLFDDDIVEKSNLNRQIVALFSTLGVPKVDAMKERILLINPDAEVHAKKVFFDEETAKEIDFSRFDFIIDAIDSVQSKLLLIEAAQKNHVAIASSMGTGNKIHPEMLEIAKIDETEVCPLARVVRAEMRKRRLDPIDVVFSREKPVAKSSQPIPSSAFVPEAAGILLASIALRRLIGGNLVS